MATIETTTQATGQLFGDDIRTFALAGNAHITIVSKRTGDRITYRIRQCKDDKNLYFVGVLDGCDNTYAYAYIGIIRNGRYQMTKKSQYTADHKYQLAFDWFWCHGGNRPDAIEVYHEGRCGRCAKRLTVPESIVSGFGSECIGKL